MSNVMIQYMIKWSRAILYHCDIFIICKRLTGRLCCHLLLLVIVLVLVIYISTLCQFVTHIHCLNETPHRPQQVQVKGINHSKSAAHKTRPELYAQTFHWLDITSNNLTLVAYALRTDTIVYICSMHIFCTYRCFCIVI